MCAGHTERTPMTITQKAQNYSNYFKSNKRDNGETYVYLSDDRPEELQESVREAHGERLPNDFTYGSYADLLQKVTEYEVNTIDDLEDVRHEIVDGYVDIYTSDLTKWLHDDIHNVEYLNDVMENYEPKDGYQLLSMAQYQAYDNIMTCIVDLLSK